MARQKTNYFPHDSNARNDDKIISLRMKYGMEGYGVYFAILERLRDEDDYRASTNYDAIAFDLRAPADIVRSVIEDFGLFVVEGNSFYSTAFNNRMGALEEKREKRKKAAVERWKKADDAKCTENDANAQDLHKTESEEQKSDAAENAEKGQNDAKCTENDANAMQVHTKSDATNETNILSPNVDNIKETPNGVKKAAVAAAPQARLTKPTVVQVDEYMREYATQHHVPITFTAQGWLDHYESNGWRVGRNPMRDWKAAVRTWFNQRHEYGNTQKARHDPRRGVEAGDASKKDWDSTF